MHSLWSRAAQTRCTCRCPSCLSTSTVAIARRATTSTSRRVFRPFTSSTFYYSAIFAAATVVDARFKQERRKQWDAAIADAKQGLDAVNNQGDTQEDIYVDTEAQGLQGNAEAGAYAQEEDQLRLAVEVPDEGGLPDTVQDVSPVSDRASLDSEQASFSDTASATFRPEWPVNTGPNLNIYHLPPQSLWSSDRAKRKLAGSRWSPKKLRTMDLSMTKLVLQFTLHAKLYDPPVADLDSLPTAIKPYASLSLDELKAILQEVNASISSANLDPPWMRGEGQSSRLPTPYYQQDSWGNFHRVCQDLNMSISSLFERHASLQDISFTTLLSRISYNLLISTAPPNLETYNLLISWFARLRKDALVDSVIKSLRETHVRPNEQTCAAVLRHYTKRNDPISFAGWVDLMRGLNDGLMLARPDINITEAGASRLLRSEKRLNKVIQKVYPTPIVYNEIITGLLKFAGFESAVEACANLNVDGWGLDAVGLGLFLRDCLIRKDWDSGQTVWRQMQLLSAKSLRGLSEEAYVVMLRLCRCCGRESEYKNVFQEAVENGYTSAALLKRFGQMIPRNGDLARRIVGAKSKHDTSGSQHQAAMEQKSDPEVSIMPVESSSTDSQSAMPEVRGAASSEHYKPAVEDRLGPLPSQHGEAELRDESGRSELRQNLTLPEYWESFPQEHQSHALAKQA